MPPPPHLLLQDPFFLSFLPSFLLPLPSFYHRWWKGREGGEQRSGRSKRSIRNQDTMEPREKRQELEVESAPKNHFDSLSDDLVISILAKVSSSATCPSDLISAMSTYKRFNLLGLHKTVLSKACPQALAIKARNWTDSAQRFLKRCAEAGNLDACFMFGMILFYCLGNRSAGISLMAMAALNFHAESLYSLAIMHLNGVGEMTSVKDLGVGVLLCAQAASLGHINALRELGHCLQEGYGSCCDVVGGRRLLIQANVREFALALPSLFTAAEPWSSTEQSPDSSSTLPSSEGGWSFRTSEPHPVHQFLVDWFSGSARADLHWKGLKLCTQKQCGRPETRRLEFRPCSECGAMEYCSRSCQTIDWRANQESGCDPQLGEWPLLEEEDDDEEEEDEASDGDLSDGMESLE